VTSFDDLVGTELAGPERERLRDVHDLIFEAGPPPELSPKLAAGPTLQMTLGRVRRITSGSRRRLVLPAMAAAFLIVLVVSLLINGNKQRFTAIPLRGTAAALHSSGILDVLASSGKSQPMVINVRGLQAGSYVVYLVRKHRPWAECGSFKVLRTGAYTTAKLNSPYALRVHDSWVVTREAAGRGHGVTVLRPTA